MGAISKNQQLYETVTTGPGCELSDSEAPVELNRVLIHGTDDLPSEAIMLFQKGKVQNLHTIAVRSSLDYDTVSEAFANCPCKDPANVNKNLGKAGCLALQELK